MILPNISSLMQKPIGLCRSLAGAISEKAQAFMRTVKATKGYGLLKEGFDSFQQLIMTTIQKRKVEKTCSERALFVPKQEEDEGSFIYVKDVKDVKAKPEYESQELFNPEKTPMAQ